MINYVDSNDKTSRISCTKIINHTKIHLLIIVSWVVKLNEIQ